MRRPPGLWILLSAGVVWLSLQDVYGIRATALIFGKSTTTSTTTTTIATPEQPEASEEEVATTELGADANSTKPTLTGNPQIDYIWDPNLPKELNGHNLSDYPFYERVPEDIDFKCDGLHDGFYASVAHKCQVYHHCLFGTRYDFLCANYTAFDQTLFNCNFASNVDCENSKKFWHRNDELYKEKSTTTSAPVVYNFYTPPPQAAPLTPSPAGYGQPPPLPPADLPLPRRDEAPRPRPYGRRRPQYDYDYDPDYELPRPKGRKRRPRPRPAYYDDYEEYEDDRFVRRGGSRRRPYNRRDRPMRRNKDRRKYDYDDVDYRYEYDDVVGKKQKDKRRKPVDDYEYEDDRRDRYDKRRPQSRRNEKPLRQPDKRPVDDDYDYEEDERYDRRKAKDDVDKRRALNEKNDENKKIPRLGKRRPPSEDYEDDLQRADNPRSGERARKSNKEGSYVKPPEDGRPIIKPVSGTIYDRPRVAPRINLPVPKNAAGKFAYKSIGSPTTTPVKLENDQFEEYAEASIKQLSEKEIEIPASRPSSGKPKDGENSERSLKSSIRSRAEIDKTRVSSTTQRSSSAKSTIEDEYDDYDEETVSVENEKSSSTSTTAESIIGHSMPVIRKFKRPFLPSRGGNPYSSRSLQPVGGKASSKNDTQDKDVQDSEDLSRSNTDEIQEVKPVSVRVKSPLLSKPIDLTPTEVSSLPNAEVEQNEPKVEAKPIRIKVPIRVVSPLTDQDPRTQTQNLQGFKISDSAINEQGKLTESDILNGNYDVTLNEAISPIIPQLPVRGFGDFSPANNYAYKRIQRPTKYVILDPVVSDSYYVK